MTEPLELALPHVFRRTVSYISALEEGEFKQLLNTMAELSPSDPAEEIVDRLTDVLPAGPGSSMTTFLEFAMSSRRLVATFETDANTIADALTRAYQSGSDHEISPTTQERILAVLTADFVKLRSKSTTLAGEAETRLRDARSITDLRPVFGAEGSTEEVLGFLVMHTLKLEVSGGRSEPLFLGIERDMILKLRGVLDRALEKEARLTRLLTDSEIENLSVRREEDQ